MMGGGIEYLMNILWEILGDEGADIERAYVVVPDFGAYLKNVKSVDEYSGEKIVVNLHKSKLTVEGDNLYIGKYFEGDLLILGKVKRTFYE
jgi:hypothetical protein